MENLNVNNSSSGHGQSPEGARPAAPGYYFAQIPTYLLDAVIAGQIPDTALRVYATIWRRYAFMGKIFPSWDTLAKDCGLSRRTVARILQQLREVGAITWTARFDDQGQTSNEYALADRLPFVFTYGQADPTQSRGGVTNGTGGMSQMAPDVKKTPTKEVTTPPTPREDVADPDVVAGEDADSVGGEEIATGDKTQAVAEALIAHVGFTPTARERVQAAAIVAKVPDSYLERLVELSGEMDPPEKPGLWALRGRVRHLKARIDSGVQSAPRRRFLARSGASPEGHEDVSTELKTGW